MFNAMETDRNSLTNGVRTNLLESHIGNERSVAIVGAPMSHGQPRAGAETGPGELRKAGILKRLQELGLNVEDTGDVECPVIHDDPPCGNTKRPRSVGKSTENISKAVNAIVSSGKIALILGGDHSIAIGSIHGHLAARPDACVLWIDAHADINTPLVSPSGNIHGMPMSFLLHELKEYIPNIPGFEWLDTCLNAKSLAYIGLRDVDPGEIYIIKKFGIPCFSMHEVDRYGINYCVTTALKLINPNMNRPIHLSFDIDALTPDVAPSTGTPVPGGLSLREGSFICEEIASTGMLSAVDLAEVNTILGDTESDRDMTVNSAVEMILSCFGKERRGVFTQPFHLPLAEKSNGP